MSVDQDYERYKGSFISVEYAKSNKAKCYICNSLIDKNCLRIGAYYEPPEFADQYSIFKWHHLTCYKYLNGAMVDLENYDVKDIQGFNKLKQTDQDIVSKQIQDLKASGTWKKKKIKFDLKKKKNDDESEDDEYNPKNPTKKVKKVKTEITKKSQKNKKDDSEDDGNDNKEHKGYTDTQYKKYCELKEQLKDKKNDYLKEQLKNNLQSYSGQNKSQLIEKVADGLVLGAIGKCPKCYGGRPKFDYHTGTYYCRGYQDDADYLDCKTTFKLDEIERLEWKTTN